MARFYRVILLLLLMTITVAWSRMTGPSNSLNGYDEKCWNEGERVDVDLVAENPCFQCFCRKGRVECDYAPCPSLQGCHAILYMRTPGACCDQCKGCDFNGTSVPHHKVWTDSADPCLVRMCQAGVLTTSRDLCRPPCNNPVKLPGQCCPSCSGCFFEGKPHGDGDTFMSRYDKDLQCSCQGGNITCVKRACPVLNCPQESLVKVKGQKCPQCKGQRRVYTLRESCYFAKQVYDHGDVTMLDSCTSCVCQLGTMTCERTQCPELSCPPSDRIVTAGDCCPHCRKRKSCKYGAKLFKHGETWKQRWCKDCVCDNGRKWCRPRKCPKITQCPLGQKMVLAKGRCCTKCIKDEKVCSVSGSNYDQFKTFDGRVYNMTGRCKYSMLKDCGKNKIGVKIRYQPRDGQTTTMGHVSVTFGTHRVKLYRNHKIRVNRTRLASKTVAILPQRFYVRVRPSHLVVHDMESSLQVVWDMVNSTVKLKVDSRFKDTDRLCGLCGNYNGRPNDDFVNKKGRVLTKPRQMSRSWSKKKTCFVEKG